MGAKWDRWNFPGSHFPTASGGLEEGGMILVVGEDIGSVVTTVVGVVD